MTRPSIGVVLPRTDTALPIPVGDMGEFGVFVEELGYESVWTGEMGSDSIAELTEVAIATDDIRVGTSVLNVFTRTPLEIAMAGESLSRVSGGQAVIGVGASHPGKVVDLHGLEYSRPLRRTHEAVELIKLYTNNSGESFDYQGEIFQLEDVPSLDIEVPVYNGALGEKNRQLTGRLCDGWLPFNIPYSMLEGSFEPLADAARDADRDPADIEVLPWVPAAVSDDAAAARYHVKKIIATFAGRYYDNTYRNAIGQAYPEESKRLAELWRSGRHETAIENVPDEMVDDFGVAGTPDNARMRLQSLIDQPVVDTPILHFPSAGDQELTKRTLVELSPVLL